MTIGRWVVVGSCVAFGFVLGPSLARRINLVVKGGSNQPTRSRWRLVSVLTATLFGVVAWRLRGWQLPGYLAMTGFLIVLSLIDMDTKTLPRRVIYAMGASGVLLLTPAALLMHEPQRLATAALGALLLFALMFLLHLFARGALGFGDVRLAAPLGWFVGWQRLAAVTGALFFSFILSGVVSAGLLLARKVDRRTKIPFGPFLAAGTLAVLLR